MYFLKKDVKSAACHMSLTWEQALRHFHSSYLLPSSESDSLTTLLFLM